MRSRIRGKPKIVPRSVPTTVQTQRQSMPDVSAVDKFETTITATVAQKAPATNGRDVSGDNDALDYVDDQETAQHPMPKLYDTLDTGTADETTACKSSPTVFTTWSRLKTKPKIVPRSVTTPVQTQRQPTSGVSSFDEVDTMFSATAALEGPVAFGLDASGLKNASDFDVSKVKDAPDCADDHEITPHAQPARSTTFHTGTADETLSCRSFSVNRPQSRLDNTPGESVAKANVVSPDATLSGPQAPDTGRHETLCGVEWYRGDQEEPHPTAIHAEPRGQLMMPLEHYIYFNPPGMPMSHKDGVSSAEEDIGSTGRNNASLGNATLGSAIRNGPETAKVRVTVSFNGENTLGSKSLPMQVDLRATTHAVVRDMGIPEANYSSFQERHHIHRCWSAEETARFYRALKIFGTDFDLMTTAFPNRTHKNLKNKFKREERENRDLVQRIINDPSKFNLEGFEDEFSWPKGPEPMQKHI